MTPPIDRRGATAMLNIRAPYYTVLQASRYGWFTSMINDLQTAAVMFQGEACPAELDFLCSLLQPGDCVIDIGASAGFFSLAFARTVQPGGKVFSVEPQTIPYQCLTSNAVNNSLSHIIFPIHAAAGEAPGEIEVPLLDPFSPDHGGCSLADKTEGAKIPTPIVTIDAMRVPSCRLIKIDVEGMEPKVLKGAYQTVSKFRPILWVEYLIYTADARPGLQQQLLEIFEEHDYESWHIQTGSFGPQNARRQTINPFGEGTGDQNVLAVPSGTLSPTLSETLSKLHAIPFNDLKNENPS